MPAVFRLPYGYYKFCDLWGRCTFVESTIGHSVDDHVRSNRGSLQSDSSNPSSSVGLVLRGPYNSRCFPDVFHSTSC
jgi:hypothetical protein